MQETAIDAKEEGLAMKFAYRELMTPGMAGVCVGVGLFFSIQFAILGVLETGTMRWYGRFGYWALVGALNLPVCYITGWFTIYAMRNRRQFEIAAGLAVAALFMVATCTAITFTISRLFQGQGIAGVPLAKVAGHCALPVFGATVLVYHVLRMRVGTQRKKAPGDGASVWKAGIEEHGEGAHPGAGAAPEGGEDASAAAVGQQTEAAAPAGRFFDRLPQELGTDIIYLAASAHYVDVVTAAGRASILLRFSDAVAELGDLGIRVHRSYWVAYRHVKQAVRREGRPVLLLTADHEVRVGRNYLPEVRAAVPKAWVRARRMVANNTD